MVRINASDLKEAFKALKPLYKGSQSAMLIGFSVNDYILSITGLNNLLYEQRIACEFSGPYSLTVLYQDLSELLPGTGTVDLELTPLYVGIKSQNMSAVLQQANGLLSPYKPRCSKFDTINPDELENWARTFAVTSPLVKSLGREAPIIFKPPYAVVKYPTFWLQLPNHVLDTTMSLRELKTIAEYAPTQFSVAGDVIEFKRGSSIMAMPRNTVDSCKYIDTLVQTHGEQHLLRTTSCLPKIQQFLRSVGAGSCKCFFYSDGIELSVSRATIQSSLKIGACSVLTTVIPTFLEYVQMLFKLCDSSDATISWDERSFRMKTQSLELLLSYV